MKSLLHSITDLFKENHYYFLVIFVFLLASYYHYAIAPMPAIENSDTRTTVLKHPTLSSRDPEEMYQNVFQPQQGDIFRLGLVVKVQRTQTIEVYLHSIFDERVKAGSIVAEPTPNGQYRELVFTVPGRYQDIVLRLAGTLEETGSWSDSSVYVDSFFVSRLEIRGASEVKTLQSTLFGISETRAKHFSIREENGAAPKTFKMAFLAEDDFVQSIGLKSGLIEPSSTGYSVALSQFDVEKKSVGEEVRANSFSSETLSGLQEPDGGYVIPFPSFLNRGQWYILTFTKDHSEEHSTFSDVFHIGKEEDQKPAKELEATLVFGSHMSSGDGKTILDRARLEDLGKTFSYQFSLQGEEVDFENLSAATKSIHFDQKERLVGGSKKHGEYFVYTFDTLYPFEIFSLKAEQSGSATNGLQLEYSVDNISWQMVPFTQEPNGPQKFFLSLPGDKKSRAVSLRVTYIGQERKTGIFGLKELSVNAVVPKNVR